MNLLTMQELAKHKQQELDILGEDWKGKIEQIPQLVKMVKNWQNTVFEKFGQPRVHSKNDYRGWLDVSPGQLLPIEEIQMDNVRFNGATIVQGLSLDLKPKDRAVVTYKAVLMTDENYFLRKMLPDTVKIPVHDPAYDLVHIEIEVPRSQLVKESIYALDDIVGRHESPVQRHTKKAGKWSLKHWQALSVIAGVALFAVVVFAVGQYISTLPPPEPMPEPSPAVVETVTTESPLGALFDSPALMFMMIIVSIVMFIYIIRDF